MSSPSSQLSAAPASLFANSAFVTLYFSVAYLLPSTWFVHHYFLRFGLGLLTAQPEVTSIYISGVRAISEDTPFAIALFAYDLFLLTVLFKSDNFLLAMTGRNFCLKEKILANGCCVDANIIAWRNGVFVVNVWGENGISVY